MTPDDMEGRIKRLIALVENDECHWNLDGPPQSDCVDVLVSDLRALLLDYQERGRALEPFARAAVEAERQTGTNETSSPLALCRAARGETAWADYTRARATLKGKSHD